MGDFPQQSVAGGWMGATPLEVHCLPLTELVLLLDLPLNQVLLTGVLVSHMVVVC